MSTKSIKQILPAQKVNMGGHILDQPLPVKGLQYADPFLLIHHWNDTLPPNQNQKDIGVGPHPHRGFSPVTFIYKGDIVHRDSMGNQAKLENGGTQWMFAGAGITHSERHSKSLAKNGGDLEFIQFWVNAPADKKMSPPSYLPISKEETPLYTEDGIEIAVVAGAYKEVKGVAPTQSPQSLLRVEIKANTSHLFEIPESYTTLIYLLDGELQINNSEVAKAKDLLVMNQDGSDFSITAKQDTRFIILSGEPLNEPMLSHGPFVMNNETQLMQAMRDAQMGKMGVLIEEFE